MNNVSLLLPDIVNGIDLIVVTLLIIGFIMVFASISKVKFHAFVLLPVVEFPLLYQFFAMFD